MGGAGGSEEIGQRRKGRGRCFGGQAGLRQHGAILTRKRCHKLCAARFHRADQSLYHAIVFLWSLRRGYTGGLGAASCKRLH